MMKDERLMLNVEGLSVGYGDVGVLHDVSLTCPKGTVVALLGPNGAGKTTLLKAIAGLIRSTSGNIILDGQDVTGLKTHSLSGRGLCLIPEGRGIFPSLTVKENLSLFAPRGRLADSTERAVTSFPILGKRLSQTAGSLSGGEQQMLAMVRAYVSDARLVLIDEASMGLAPLVVDELFAFMGHMAEEGTTLVVVEQYIDRALALASTVYLLNRGRVAFCGAAGSIASQEIFERYLSAEV